MSASATPMGSGPYASSMAGLGGLPSVAVDVPITAVFLALFIGGAATHMTIFQLNKRKGHKFNMSGALFGFNMARITASVLRIVWANRQTSVQIAIAANIFFNAGVIIIMIINLLFAQRLLRAMHPKFGWSRAVHFAFLAFFFSIPAMLVALITSIIQQSYTLDEGILAHDRIIQKVGATYFAASAFIPIPIIVAAVLAGKTLRPQTPMQKFGTGRFRTKVLVLLLAATLICLGASFRAGIGYVPRPRANPAWYHSKACFYCFDFMIEVIVIYMYAIVRVDRRFHVPDGSSVARHYHLEEEEKRENVSGGSGFTRVEDNGEFVADFRPEVNDEKEDAKDDDLRLAERRAEDV